MNFQPLKITRDNFEVAINENFRRAQEAMESKQLIASAKPMPQLDCNGNRVFNSTTKDELDAMTLGYFLEKLNERA